MAAEPAEGGGEDDLPPMLDLALKPWTGDFDQMIERSMIRVVIPVSLTTFFLDGATQKGPTYDLVQEFEKYLKKTLGKRAHDLTVVVIPGRRDRIFDMVVDGRADIAAGIITVTEDRAKLVSFSPPFRSDVKEVIVTGKGTSMVDSLDDLVGIEIYVRRSTSFWVTLERINKEREDRGAETLTIVPADELLRTEDLLEMVGAGIIQATAAESPVAELLTRHFDGLVIQNKVPLAEGRSYAWAYRKGDAKLAEALAGFLKTAAKGTMLGNIILKKYTKDTDWISGGSRASSPQGRACAAPGCRAPIRKLDPRRHLSL